MSARPRVALVHDWLTGMRGGELVLEALIDLFPEAELFTLVYVEGSVSSKISKLRRHVSPMRHVPDVKKFYRHFLPAMPTLIERFDLSGYDLVISSSHCVAKGVRKAPGAVHVSYVHAPMRYVWDRFDDYFGEDRAPAPVRVAARALRPYLQAWDRRVSQPDRVDRLVANSKFIAEQIRQAYGRGASVVHPFADLSRFQAPRSPGNRYLMVGAFAPNKRVDLAIRAFNQLGLPLLIVGSGQEEAKLRAMAGPTVEFAGPLSNDSIAEAFSRCRAFIFPGVEDFGITPVEAMAAGAPVIAFGQGGALETVTERTGVFFTAPTAEALAHAVFSFERGEVTLLEEDCRKRAAGFSRERFMEQFRAEVREAWVNAGKDPEQL